MKKIKVFFLYCDEDWDELEFMGEVWISVGSKGFKLKLWYYRFGLVEIFLYIGGVNEDIREK